MAEVMKGAGNVIRLLLVVCVIGGAATGFFSMRGCHDVMSKPDDRGRVPTEIAGKTFMLEPALDNATRELGLGKRETIDPKGGMVFVFPRAGMLGFVMRDCPKPIDIAFLDDSGRIGTMHEMQPEAPQGAEESRSAYESRLKRYSSRFPCRVVVEVAGGTLRSLGVKEGDKMKLDIEGLKRRAQ